MATQGACTKCGKQAEITRVDELGASLCPDCFEDEGTVYRPPKAAAEGPARRPWWRRIWPFAAR